MLELSHRYPELVSSGSTDYRARVYGEPLDNGMWGAWLVFFPKAGPAVATTRETTQSTFADLKDWAAGLTHVYLQGALERALALQPEAQIASQLERLERLESEANARAEILDDAASVARAESRMAGAVRERTEEELLDNIAHTASADAAAHENAAAQLRAEAELADEALRVRKRSAAARKTRNRRKKEK